MTPKKLIAALVLSGLTAMPFAACSSSSESKSSQTTAQSSNGAEATDPGSGDEINEALEAQAPTGTVEVPSEAGATTIADFSSGASSYESPDAAELAQILAVVGTNADGYITDDTVVVRTTKADASLHCSTFKRMNLSTYTFIPVLPDGAGVDCSEAA